MEKFVSKVISKMLEYGYIEEKQSDEYIYAMTVLIETWILIFAVMLIGICHRATIATFLFLVFFAFIKKRSGGYHAKKFICCFFISIIIYLIFIVFLMPIMIRQITVTYIVLVISIIILEIIGAVNHPNMNWDDEEYKESKKASRIVVLMEGVIILFLAYLDVDKSIIVCTAFAVILSAALLLLAKITKQEVSHEKGSF